MTEQQAQSPIDDLFRNAFENLPDTPAESGWDTPSDNVWQQVQTNIQAPQKSWSLKSVLIAAAGFTVILVAVALFWINSGQETPQTPVGSGVQPSIEQPAISPAVPAEKADSQPLTTPSTGLNKAKTTPEKPAPRNSTEEKQPKAAGSNGAQPLPGSKTVLPPNSTEAKKQQDKQ